MSPVGGAIPWAPKDKREARIWVRAHWKAFMRSADVPDLFDVMPERSDELISEVFCEESSRLADRLQLRAAKPKTGNRP